jgi:PAS domain S-box-containing protein
MRGESPASAFLSADALRPPPRRRQFRAIDLASAQRLFVTEAVLAVLAAALFSVLPRDLPAGHRALLVAMLLAFAGGALLALRVSARQAGFMVGLLSLLAMLLVGALLAVVGGGAAAAIGFYGLIALMSAAVGSHRFTACVAGLAVLISGASAWLALQGGAPSAADRDTVLLGLALQWLTIAAGLAWGWLLAQMLHGHVAAADEREQRFRRLLALAADAYWEIDAEYRLVALSLHDGRDGPDNQGRAVDDEALGHVPWALPQVIFDAETLDALQADLDARAVFRNVPLRWVTTEGEILHFCVSGEPRIDSRGVFSGYWGVARDVSDDVSARAALAATEGRYQDLFEHIPTPLLLHRQGRIVDANPAAQALFGHDEGMAGIDLLSLYEGGDSRERARRRVEELENFPLGRALAVSDFRLRGRGGRRIAVRGTGVRVDAEGGPATLSIYIDDTERRNAEDAVRRSETMLSHLVATSPDVITLTELASGRYAMVNRTFERLTGYASAEVVGRTSAELGVWFRPAQRDEFVALIQRDGAVQDLPVEFLAKDGHVVAMLVSGARFMMDRREYLVINARDVTDAEQQRLEREAILDTASIGIAFTRDRYFVLANPCFERMYGWPEGSLSGQPGRVVWASDEDYARVGALVGPPLARGEVVEFEHAAQRRDGSTFVARTTANAIDPKRPAEGGTVWIIEDVTGQREAEAQLARARDEAEAANRAKSAFLANTSHELRTPLNGMIGLARLARDPDIDPVRRGIYLEQIGESAESLAAIISDILDLSRIESGKLVLESAPFDLGALLRSLHVGYSLLASPPRLKLQIELGPNVETTVRGDALRLRQIVSNFLGNALKFTERGEVRLVVRRLDPQLLRFEVHDTGPGIDLATQARLFRPFTQADESTTRRFGGSGLGLSICRELATLMGGSVGVHSSPGQGSCFWAELPLPQQAAEPAVEAPARPAVHGARVLLVEDNAVNMMIAAAMLEQWGVTVEQACDGQQAIDAVAAATAAGRPFDAVLMDVHMPQMSGFEATRRLRERYGQDALPIIALTAAALVSERDEALAAGMNDFLTKPIDTDRLRQTLSRWAGWRAALRQPSP